MTSRAETYNYPAYSFGLESEAYEYWLRHAPPLGGLAPPFELPDLEGRHHRLGDFGGRPVVVEFGSYTCPIFCGHIPAMENHAWDHPEAVFLVIYTREATPVRHSGPTALSSTNTPRLGFWPLPKRSAA